MRGEEDVEEELNGIVEVEEQVRESNARGWKGLAQPWVRPAVIVGCGMAMFTQLSGIEMIIYYSPTILTSNGFETSAALLVSVGLAVTYVIMNSVGLAIVDRVGRRRLNLIMAPGAALALAALGTVFVLGADSANTAPLIVACLIVFMFFTAGGIQIMGWLTESEVYPLGVRGAGTAVTATTLWSTNLLITLTLLTTINAIGVGPTMWMYAGFNVLAFLFIYWKYPEVGGRSLEEIETSLWEDKFRPGDIQEVDEEAAAAR